MCCYFSVRQLHGAVETYWSQTNLGSDLSSTTYQIRIQGCWASISSWIKKKRELLLYSSWPSPPCTCVQFVPKCRILQLSRLNLTLFVCPIIANCQVVFFFDILICHLLANRLTPPENLTLPSDVLILPSAYSFRLLIKMSLTLG